MRKRLSLLLSLVMLFSLLVPVVTGAEQVPDVDPLSVKGEAYDEDTYPGTDDPGTGGGPDAPSVPDSVYEPEVPPVTDPLLDLKILSTSGAEDSFAGGTGTTGDPYQIADGSQFAYLAQLVNSGAMDTINGKVYAEEAYVLTGDIDLSTYPWTPIGQNTDGLKFTGSFDGNNKTISGLNINETITDYVGLFRVVGAGGLVKDLTLSGATVSGKRYVGAVSGEIEGAVVENVHMVNNCSIAAAGVSTGAAPGADAGGLVGRAEETFQIKDCTVRASSVTGSRENVGGILGYAGGSGMISSCAVFDTQVETTYSNVGGICGNMMGGSAKYEPGIFRCSFTGGSVKTEGGFYAGGIAGNCTSYKENTVSECYANTEVYSNGSGAGGIVGWSNHGEQEAITVLDCYSGGTVTSRTSSQAGGVVGSGKGVKNCYTTAGISAQMGPAGIGGTYNISSCVALNSSITTYDRSIQGVGRIFFHSFPNTVGAEKNYSFSEMPVREETKLIYIPSATRTQSGMDGEDVSYAQLSGGFFSGLGWDGSVWNLEAGKLPTLKNLSVTVVQPDALPAYLNESIDWKVKSFVSMTSPITVHQGTAQENIAFPAKMQVTLADDQAAEIPVTWSAAGYNGMPGLYSFIAVLPTGCSLDSGAELPVIAVTVTNQAPKAKTPVPTQVITGYGTENFDGAEIARDADGDALTITTIVTPPDANVATASLDGGNGMVTVTRAAPGTTTMVVRVSDGAAALDVTVPIKVANDAPVAKTPVPTQMVTDTGTGSSRSVAAGDIAQDEEGDPLTITAIVMQPDMNIATAALDSGNGTATVTGVVAGTTTMVVRVSDGTDTVDVTVPINVSANRAPTAKIPVPAQIIAGTGTKSFAVEEIAQDEDGDVLTIAAIVTQPDTNIATAALDGGNGTVTLTGVVSGTTTVVVTVSDGAATVDVTVPVTVSAGAWGDSASASFAGGTGTIGDPYQIADESQLAYLAQLVNAGTVDADNDDAGKTYAQKAYVLTQPLNLSAHLWTAIGQNTPAASRFTGSFNGGNKTVKGLHVVNETTDYQGLFGVVGPGGTVKNLTLSGATVRGKRYVGAVAGQIDAAVIENLHLANSSVTAAGSTSAGGLVGSGDGIFAISSCTVRDSAVATASNYSGGILGLASGYGTISSCAASGSRIEAAGSYAGGICGRMQGNSGQKDGAEIFNCGFGGSVKANRYAGGIAGYCASYKENSLRECYADAEISVDNHNAGGIAGYVASSEITVLNCYARGTVNAPTSNWAAGISANGGTIKNCFSTAVISAKEHLAAGVANSANIQNSAALNPSITMSDAASSSYKFGRVMAKSVNGSETATQNLAFKEMQVFSGGKLLYIPVADRMGNLPDGRDLSYAELAGSASPFSTAPLNWDSGVWDLAAGKLPTLKNLPAPVVQSDALPDYFSGSIDWTIKAFAYLTNSIEVDNGTAQENIGLPTQLEVTLAGGNQAAVVPVNWSGSGYDATPGVYTFTAVLPGDCLLKAGVALPAISVTVQDNCTVTFDSRSGSAIAPLSDVTRGSLISAPSAPTWPGFIFGGWFKDTACTQPWNFAADTVTDSIILYARWTVDGEPGYTASQSGIQKADITGKGFNNAAIITVAHVSGYVTYAVVAEQKIEFWGPAGAYVLSYDGLSMGPKMITSFSQNHNDTPQDKSYRGNGTAEDPYAMLGGFYLKDGSSASADKSIGATFRVWNLMAGYETEGFTDLGTPFSVMVEDRNMSTGRLNASWFVDGSKLLPSAADGWFRTPGEYGVVLNPSDQIIAYGLGIHTLYKSDAYPDRLAAATSALQAVRADSKKVLMHHTQTRDFPGPITHKLDVSGYFNEGDTVHINYLLGAANKGLYHGVSLDENYMLAVEPIYIKNSTSAVVTGGYITFDLYNGGYFELVKAQDDDSETKYVAEFAVNGGGDKLYPGTIQPQILSPGATVTRPADPAKEGYTFGGWYTDQNCTATFNFEAPLTRHIVLFAKWTEQGGGNPGGDEPVANYTVTFVTGNDPDTGKPNATINDQTVQSGKKARDPGFFDSGYGYLVLAWYTDRGLTNEYNFNSTVTSNLTLYPQWMRYILKDDLKKDGGSGSQSNPYLAHLADSKQSKIAWKALNEIAGESEWWKVYVTKNNNPGGKERYAWTFNGEDIKRCDTAQPYYTDVILSKKSDGAQAKFVWRTAIEGKVHVSINVSDYFDDGDTVAISYVAGSCDGKVAHTNVETGEWVDSLHHPATYYSGGTSLVENGYVTLELTHGGTYLLKSDENAQNVNPGTGAAVEDPETGSVYINAVVEAKDGAATISIPDAAIETIIKALVEKNEDQIVIAPTITGEASKISIEFTRTAAAGIVEQTAAVLVLKTDIANVTVSNDMLAKIAAKKGEKVTLTVEKIDEENFKLEIKLDDEVIERLGGLMLAVPVAEAGDGVVAVLVNADGSEEIIKKSVINEGRLLAVLNGSATIKFMDRSRSFNDVAGSFWGRGAVAFATSHELFSGISETEFAPNAPMTRGMLVSVLHRLENTPAGGDIDFADVKEDDWYTEAVAWAAGNGIASGTDRGFEPGADITREQIAVMLYQYAKLIGADTGVQGDAAQFGDAEQISGWAADAVSWAVGTGLLQGKDGNALDPRGKATRAEVAAISQRLVAKVLFNVR